MLLLVTVISGNSWRHYSQGDKVISAYSETALLRSAHAKRTFTDYMMLLAAVFAVFKFPCKDETNDRKYDFVK